MCKLYPTEPDLSIETVAGEDRKYNGHSCLIAKVTSEERGEPCTLWGKTVTEREQPLLKPSGEACTAWAGASKEPVWLKWSKSRGCRRTQTGPGERGALGGCRGLRLFSECDGGHSGVLCNLPFNRRHWLLC